jgi:hypothetical protein
MSNITYVSCLVALPDDRISIEQRLTWLQPLLDCSFNLVLFVDHTYAEHVKDTANITTKLIDVETLETFKSIRAANPRLPLVRNETKDTVNFMALMNSKAELLVRAKPFVKTPYVAYIDAGISKVFKEPATLKRLETLQVHNIPLVLMPGCHPIKEVESFPFLWKGIHWMLSGGFFVVPMTCVDEFYELHAAALQKFLDIDAVTWEVNVWASFAHKVSERIVWYMGLHTDEMILGIPERVILSR